MGTYFNPVTPDQVNAAVSAASVNATTATAGAQTTVPVGSTGSTATQTTVPYASPSTFTTTPLNQMGPYDATQAFGGMDPNAMVTTGPGAINPAQGNGAVVGYIKDFLAQAGYGKPPSGMNDEDWVIQTLEKHYTNNGGALVVVPGGVRSEPAPAKPGTPAAKPPANRGTKTDQSQLAVTPNTGAVDSVFHSLGQWGGDALGFLGLHTGSTIAQQKDPNFVPGKGDKQPGLNGQQLNLPTTDPKLSALAQHLGLTFTSGVPPWAQIASSLGLSPSTQGQPTQMKAGDLAQFALQTMNQQQVTALQDQLWQAGFYDSKSWTPGIMDLPTKQALGGLLKTTAYINANAGKDGSTPANLANATVWDVLNSETAKVQKEGGIDALNASSASKKYTEATQSQMDLPTLNAFEARLGRAPTAQELAGATAQMQQQQADHATSMPTNAYIVPGEGGVSAVPGVTTPTALAAQYAMTQDPNEYEGHSLANAYALMINALSAKPVGSDPNVTSATRPL